MRETQAQQPEAISSERARQGVTGHNVRYVLGISLGSAIVILALVYFVFFVVR